MSLTVIDNEPSARAGRSVSNVPAAEQAAASLTLSRFVSTLTVNMLPPEAIAGAKRHLLDAVGTGLIGSRQEMPRRALASIETVPGSRGGTSVWGRAATLAAPYAAMINGIAAHALDFDDTHTDSITHGSAVLGPTVLALGEELDAAGRDVILAFVAGWETIARVGLAARGSFHKRGFHTTSVAGIFGAVAAAGKLLGLSEAQLSHALGLAGSQVAGVSEYLSNGSSSKIFHPGWAAHSGIVAAYMARAGMTGPMTVFEGRYGLLRTYGISDDSDVGRLTAGLGAHWEITRISVKPYPCCHFAHAFIDCARALRRQGIRAEEIEQLQCIVPEIELPLICEPWDAKLRPDSAYAAKFSLPFLVAAALIDDTVNHDTFAAKNLTRRDLLELAGLVTYRAAAAEELPFPKYFPGWIQGTLRGGRRIEQRLEINYGNPDNPMSRADIERKFCSNAAGVLPQASIAGALSTVAVLENSTARDLTRFLASRNQESS